MKSYSQNKEDIFVLNYFGTYRGNLLEVGSNNGIDLSNSKLLIENGWEATLLEPGHTFKQLHLLHHENEDVLCLNIGIGDKDEIVTFYESANHVPHGKDSGLVSSANYSETERWRKSGVQFKESKVQLFCWSTFLKLSTIPLRYDFISIDAESFDWLILKQIDLQAIGCRCLCIEWNSDAELLKLFTEYCKGFKLVVKNAENLIFIK